MCVCGGTCVSKYTAEVCASPTHHCPRERRRRHLRRSQKLRPASHPLESPLARSPLLLALAEWKLQDSPCSCGAPPSGPGAAAACATGWGADFLGRPRLRRGMVGSGSGSGLGERMYLLPSSSTISTAQPFHPRLVFFFGGALATEPAGVEGPLSKGAEAVGALAAALVDPLALPALEAAPFAVGRAGAFSGAADSGASEEGSGFISDEARGRVDGVLPRPGGGVAVDVDMRVRRFELADGAGDACAKADGDATEASGE